MGIKFQASCSVMACEGRGTILAKIVAMRSKAYAKH